MWYYYISFAETRSDKEIQSLTHMADNDPALPMSELYRRSVIWTIRKVKAVIDLMEVKKLALLHSMRKEGAIQFEQWVDEVSDGSVHVNSREIWPHTLRLRFSLIFLQVSQKESSDYIIITSIYSPPNRVSGLHWRTIKFSIYF